MMSLILSVYVQGWQLFTRQNWSAKHSTPCWFSGRPLSEAESRSVWLCLVQNNTTAVQWWYRWRAWSAHCTKDDDDIRGICLRFSVLWACSCICLLALQCPVMIQMTSLKCIALNRMMTFEAFVWGWLSFQPAIAFACEHCSVQWWYRWRAWSAHCTKQDDDIRGICLRLTVLWACSCICLWALSVQWWYRWRAWSAHCTKQDDDIRGICLRFSVLWACSCICLLALQCPVMIQMTSLKCIALNRMMTFEAFVWGSLSFELAVAFAC